MLKYLFLLLLILVIPNSSSGQLKEQVAAHWKGENFKPNEGGIFFKLVPSKGMVKRGAGRSDLKLINVQNLKIYRLSYNLVKDSKQAVKIFKLPVGEYKIAHMMVKTRRGSYQYQGPSKDLVSVGPMKINNGGRWFVIERKGNKILLVKKDKKSPIKNKPAPTPRTTAKPPPTNKMGIPLLPSQRGGKKSVPKPSAIGMKKPIAVPVMPTQKAVTMPRTSVPSSGSSSSFQAPKSSRMLPKLTLPSKGKNKYQDVRATYRTTRTISMFYKIDLKRFNRYAPAFRKVFEKADPAFRSCYTESLEDNEKIKGFIQFKFLYSRKDRAFRTLKVTRQSLKAPKMIECLYWEVAGLEFNVGKDMLGDLMFNFSTK